jgi:hypothetical protein
LVFEAVELFLAFLEGLAEDGNLFIFLRKDVLLLLKDGVVEFL